MDTENYMKLEGNTIKKDIEIMGSEIQSMQNINKFFEMNNNIIENEFKKICKIIDATKGVEKKKRGRPKIKTEKELKESKKAYDLKYQKERYRSDLEYRNKKRYKKVLVV